GMPEAARSKRGNHRVLGAARPTDHKHAPALVHAQRGAPIRVRWAMRRAGFRTMAGTAGVIAGERDAQLAGRHAIRTHGGVKTSRYCRARATTTGRSVNSHAARSSGASSSTPENTSSRIGPLPTRWTVTTWP